MKNLKSFSKFFENYPPGAEHDSNAPYNQSIETEKEEFEDVIYGEDEQEYQVTISYEYNEIDSDIYITFYDYDFIEDAFNCVNDHIDDDVKECIKEHIGKDCVFE